MVDTKSLWKPGKPYPPPKSFLCGPHFFFGGEKFCAGAGRCMLSFSQNATWNSPKIQARKKSTKINFLGSRRPLGGVGVFHAKGWGSKSSCPPSKLRLPWVSKRRIWDVPGILPGLGVFKKFVQKKFVLIFRSLFSRNFIVEPPFFFARVFSPDLSPPFLWGKSAQKNRRGKSPGKSSKFYTTKILRHISADWPGWQIGSPNRNFPMNCRAKRLNLYPNIVRFVTWTPLQIAPESQPQPLQITYLLKRWCGGLQRPHQQLSPLRRVPGMGDPTTWTRAGTFLELTAPKEEVTERSDRRQEGRGGIGGGEGLRAAHDVDARLEHKRPRPQAPPPLHPAEKRERERERTKEKKKKHTHTHTKMYTKNATNFLADWSTNDDLSFIFTNPIPGIFGHCPMKVLEFLEETVIDLSKCWESWEVWTSSNNTLSLFWQISHEFLGNFDVNAWQAVTHHQKSYKSWILSTFSNGSVGDFPWENVIDLPKCQKILGKFWASSNDRMSLLHQFPMNS